MNLLATALAGLLLVMPACAAGRIAGGGEGAIASPVAVKNILYARPFTLQRPNRNTWSKDRAMVSKGVLVVLEVDPALVVPRDTLEPILYAGNAAVIRLNHGHQSGRVIAIIPGSVDLATEAIWFGSPGLPERVTEEGVRAERARAEKAGVKPFPAERIARVQQPPASAADLAALLRDVAAPLVDQYSPQEKELADQWRLPTASAVPRGRKP